MTSTPTLVGSMSASDLALLERTVAPYRTKDAIYLRSADVAMDGGQLVASGRFGISAPCYIDDTGHFNAVESLICFNQIMYYGLARAVRDGLYPALAHWTIDDYWERQLPDVLIFRQSITYRRPIDPRDFGAEFRITSIDTSALDRAMLKIATTITFQDATGGRAHGAVDLALVNVPPVR